MNISRENLVIVVLGMHRSGTSAITRTLELLGVGLGDNLHPPGSDNPTGFWEDAGVLAINESLLSQFSCAYDQFALAEDFSQDGTIVSELKLKAVSLVSERLLENNGIWGFKDPRTCRLLSFWQDVFDVVGCEVKYVIALRNPISVAASLAARNDLPEEKSFFLWQQHLLPAILNTVGVPRVVVDYDRLMDSPLEQLTRISLALNLPMPDRDSPAVNQYLGDFLDGSLRHTRFSLHETLSDRRVPADIKALYKLLSDVAADESNLDDSEQDALITELSRRMEAYAPVFSYAKKLEYECTGLHQTIAERDSEINRLNLIVADRDDEISRYRHIVNSMSWKLTKPFRVARIKFLSLSDVLKRRSLSCLRCAWQGLPLSGRSRQRLKNKLFVTLPFLFRRTQAYQNWGSIEKQNARQSNISQITDWYSNTRKRYVPLLDSTPLENPPVKLICFYLPQFHPIPENDEWWGPGFTEWTNVQPAQPQFTGHYQPHVPGELGYYNLLDPAVQSRQVELAKLYGVGGFCFYFYWFGGKRLLETPIQNFLNDSRLDMPFCLCWANESWSRRWDGRDSEILMEQQHSVEDDIAFIQHVSRYMQDPRYIRIDDKPLLLVYRPGLLPATRETSMRWRDWCRDNGIGEIYLAYTQSFEAADPAEYGFDAAVEFPPNNSTPPIITDSVTPLGDDFGCTVYDWRVFVERSEHYTRPDYKLFRSVCPSWDNTARRQNRATVFLNNTPTAYQHWLENAISDTIEQNTSPDERLIFVNAWNEWAEGAHLEPDEYYGYAWLQATRDALTQLDIKNQRQILVVTHDCHPHGAQFLALEMIRQLIRSGYQPTIIALDGGKLQDEFAQLGTMFVVSSAGPEALEVFLKKLVRHGCTNAITSTVVSGSLLPVLKQHGFRVVSLIHELPGVIRSMKQEKNAQSIAQHADKIVFPAEMVRDQFATITPVAAEKSVIRPQGLLRSNPFKGRQQEAHTEVCRRHRLADHARIVVNVGYFDLRKGADLFVEIAARVCALSKDVVFIWVGHTEPECEHKARKRIDELALQDRVLLVGYDPEPMVYYAAASVYALTSREDPFPNVVLESAAVSVPVVAFANTTGAADFIIQQDGRLARHLDIDDFAARLEELLSSGPPPERFPPDLSLQRYILDLVHLLNGTPRVSVIVPNYNYAKLIEARLESIRAQNYPIYEIIILDDASTDDSVARIRDYCDRNDVDAQIHVNEANSGSVFRQWVKGVHLASGDIVWIAEADDLASPDFLSTMVPSFTTEGVALAFCQSKQIDDDGYVMADNYLAYTDDISKRWHQNHLGEGLDEIRTAFSIKNVIPNVSSVLFDRKVLMLALTAIGDDLFTYRVAGDWLVYLNVLARGRLFYCAKELNAHRRHQQSVTKSTALENHLAEVSRVQAIAHKLAQPDEQTIAQARQYLVCLCEQFGLGKDMIDNFYDRS